MLRLRTRGPSAVLALGVGGLLLLPLLGPGCGGGGGSGGDAEVCTLLPFSASGPAKVDQRQIEMQVQFVTMPKGVVETLGIEWRQLGHAVADPGFTTYGTPDDPSNLVVRGCAVGGVVDAHRLVQPDHPDGAPLPTVWKGALDPFTDVSVHSFLPGTGCLNFDPSASLAVKRLDRLIARPVLPVARLPADFALVGARLDELQLDTFRTALESDADSRLLSAPRVTVYNGQRVTLMLRNRTQDLTDFIPAFKAQIDELAPTADTGLTGPAFDFETFLKDTGVFELRIRPAQVATLLAPEFFDVGPSDEICAAEVALTRTRDHMVRIEIPYPTTTLISGVLKDGETEGTYGVDLFRDIPVRPGLESPAWGILDGEALLFLVKPQLVGDD